MTLINSAAPDRKNAYFTWFEISIIKASPTKIAIDLASIGRGPAFKLKNDIATLIRTRPTKPAAIILNSDDLGCFKNDALIIRLKMATSGYS